MTRNQEINFKIRHLIDASKAEIFKCKGKNDTERLTYDGIICDGDNPPEILYLLKEANDGRNNQHGSKLDFDASVDFTNVALQDSIAQAGKKPSAWDNLCYWTKAFQDAKADNPHYFKHKSIQTCGGYLGQLSIVNIKKVPGASQVEDADAIKAASSNAICSKLIVDEISLINPQVVVCCGTYDYAKIIYIVANDEELDSGARYFIIPNNITFLEFMHPTQRGAAAKRALTFAYAKEVFGELKKKSLI